MLDAKYFRELFYEQARSLGTASAEMHLRNGQVFRIQRVDAVEPNYVLLTIYPSNITGDTPEMAAEMERRRKPGGDKTVYFDRLAIPYMEIAYVIMTLAEDEPNPPFGFAASRGSNAV